LQRNRVPRPEGLPTIVSLNYPYPELQLAARIKAVPQDFFVDEQLGFDPSGEGEHLLLQVEKTAMTTQQLVEALARIGGIKPRDIGYSGLKDKQAVTRQWLSLHLPGVKRKPIDVGQTGVQFQVLQADWHQRKLRVGTHQANRFRVVLRDCTGDWSQVTERASLILRHGFANYFGPQRFGAGGENVSSAIDALCHSSKRKRIGRYRRGLYLSSLRSELFNRILSRRIESGVWSQPLAGDLFMLDGSHSHFTADIDQTVLQRFASMDIHSAISLYGAGSSRIDNLAGEVERAIWDESRDLTDCLDQQDIKLDYRPARAIAADLQIEVETDRVVLSVSLGRGTYLTTLLGHFAQVDTDR
jgi:tRNA pseudouridine13 synthase